MGAECDPGILHMDSWGLKRLFSHGLRRWNAANFPKVFLPVIVSALSGFL